jgi:hypothetical protein
MLIAHHGRNPHDDPHNDDARNHDADNHPGRQRRRGPLLARHLTPITGALDVLGLFDVRPCIFLRVIAVVILGNPFGMELAQPFRYFPLRRVLLPSDRQNRQ